MSSSSYTVSKERRNERATQLKNLKWVRSNIYFIYFHLRCNRDVA